MSYDIDAMRAKVRTQMGGRKNDPDEFRPGKAEAGKDLKYRFYVLGPYGTNDILRSGAASGSMESFFMPFGIHFGVCKPPQPCPRVCNGELCEICQHGFDLYKECGPNDKDTKSVIGREWMPAQYSAVNIYFPPGHSNPKEVEGRVLYYKAPKTCLDIWISALERSGPGDAHDPQAYGAFFDERQAFLFQLVCRAKGENNSYEASTFLANGGAPSAISADPAGIAAILAARFDLGLKLDKPNIEAIHKIAQNVIHGVSTEDGGFSSPPINAAPPVTATPTQAELQARLAAAQQLAAQQLAAQQAAATQLAAQQAAAQQLAAQQAAATQLAAQQAAATQSHVAETVVAQPTQADLQAQLAALQAQLAAATTAAPQIAAPAAAPVTRVAETVQPPTGGGDDVMSEIEQMLKGFTN